MLGKKRADDNLDCYVKELEFNIKGSEVWQGEADGGDLIGFAFPKILVLHVSPHPTIQQSILYLISSVIMLRMNLTLCQGLLSIYRIKPRFFRLEHNPLHPALLLGLASSRGEQSFHHKLYFFQRLAIPHTVSGSLGRPYLHPLSGSALSYIRLD